MANKSGNIKYYSVGWGDYGTTDNYWAASKYGPQVHRERWWSSKWHISQLGAGTRLAKPRVRAMLVGTCQMADWTLSLQTIRSGYLGVQVPEGGFWAVTVVPSRRSRFSTSVSSERLRMRSTSTMRSRELCFTTSQNRMRVLQARNWWITSLCSTSVTTPSLALHLYNDPGAPGDRNDVAWGPTDYALNCTSDEIVRLIVSDTASNRDEDFVGMS